MTIAMTTIPLVIFGFNRRLTGPDKKATNLSTAIAIKIVDDALLQKNVKKRESLQIIGLSN
jgi:hypothetical protein